MIEVTDPALAEALMIKAFDELGTALAKRGATCAPRGVSRGGTPRPWRILSLKARGGVMGSGGS